MGAPTKGKDKLISVTISVTLEKLEELGIEKIRQIAKTIIDKEFKNRKLL